MEKLKDSSNFQFWKFRIVVDFKCAELMSIVNGQNSDPMKDNKPDPDWEVQDAKAQKYIIESIEEDPFNLIMSCSSAKQMFDKLCFIYEQNLIYHKASGANKTFQKLKDSTNFQAWKFSIVVHLKSAGLMSIVNGQNVDLMEDDKPDPKWKVQDAKAKIYIINSIEERLINCLLSCSSAKQMFDKLCLFYGRDSAVMNELFHAKYDSATSMANYIGKIENLAIRLRALNEPISDRMIMAKILSTLPSSYNSFQTFWDFEANKTFEKLTVRLLKEEMRHKRGKRY